MSVLYGRVLGVVGPHNDIVVLRGRVVGEGGNGASPAHQRIKSVELLARPLIQRVQGLRDGRQARGLQLVGPALRPGDGVPDVLRVPGPLLAPDGRQNGVGQVGCRVGQALGAQGLEDQPAGPPVTQVEGDGGGVWVGHAAGWVDDVAVQAARALVDDAPGVGDWVGVSGPVVIAAHDVQQAPDRGLVPPLLPHAPHVDGTDGSYGEHHEEGQPDVEQGVDLLRVEVVRAVMVRPCGVVVHNGVLRDHLRVGIFPHVVVEVLYHFVEDLVLVLGVWEGGGGGRGGGLYESLDGRGHQVLVL